MTLQIRHTGREDWRLWRAGALGYVGWSRGRAVVIGLARKHDGKVEKRVREFVEGARGHGVLAVAAWAQKAGTMLTLDCAPEALQGGPNPLRVLVPGRDAAAVLHEAHRLDAAVHQLAPDAVDGATVTVLPLPGAEVLVAKDGTAAMARGTIGGRRFAVDLPVGGAEAQVMAAAQQALPAIQLLGQMLMGGRR